MVFVLEGAITITKFKNIRKYARRTDSVRVETDVGVIKV